MTQAAFFTILLGKDPAAPYSSQPVLLRRGKCELLCVPGCLRDGPTPRPERTHSGGPQTHRDGHRKASRRCERLSPRSSKMRYSTSGTSVSKLVGKAGKTWPSRRKGAEEKRTPQAAVLAIPATYPPKMPHMRRKVVVRRTQPVLASDPTATSGPGRGSAAARFGQWHRAFAKGSRL